MQATIIYPVLEAKDRVNPDIFCLVCNSQVIDQLDNYNSVYNNGEKQYLGKIPRTYKYYYTDYRGYVYSVDDLDRIKEALKAIGCEYSIKTHSEVFRPHPDPLGHNRPAPPIAGNATGFNYTGDYSDPKQYRITLGY